MIEINGFEKEYILDLNEHPYNSNKLLINSYEEGHKVPWSVYVNTSKLVSASKSGDELLIDTDIYTFNSNATIVLKNNRQELFKILVIPNNEATMEKKYEFYTKDINLSDGILTFEIISTRNDEDYPWKCTYSGMPLSYSIIKPEYSGSTTMRVELLSMMYSDFTTKLVFTQNDSDKKIELTLLNGKEGIKKVD